MRDSSNEAGVIQVLMERFNNQRLPMALEIKAKVDAGESLSDFDLRFLDEVLMDAQKIQPWVGRHPEYQGLVVRAIGLYKEIVDKAAENEKKSE